MVVVMCSVWFCGVVAGSDVWFIGTEGHLDSGRVE